MLCIVEKRNLHTVGSCFQRVTNGYPLSQLYMSCRVIKYSIQFLKIKFWQFNKSKPIIWFYVDQKFLRRLWKREFIVYLMYHSWTPLIIHAPSHKNKPFDFVTPECIPKTRGRSGCSIPLFVIYFYIYFLFICTFSVLTSKECIILYILFKYSQDLVRKNTITSSRSTKIAMWGLCSPRWDLIYLGL